ncbi:MAG: FMN-dependent NADH-azoreductase [Terriglobia bacterium]
MRLLKVDSSARRNSVSRKLTAQYAETWIKHHPGGEVIERDLAAIALPQITDEWVEASRSNPSQLTPAQRQTLALSDTLVGELLNADVIVIGAPMYNFSISSTLKGWIDQVVRLGKTVTYGAEGPKGLLAGKKVFVLTSRGGAYGQGTHSEKYDFQEPYLRHILGFIGLTDVTFIHAENQLRESAGTSLATATEQIVKLAA